MKKVNYISLEKVSKMIQILSSKLRIYTILFIFGGGAYCATELFWRGRTHWSMALCGGLCFCYIYLINSKLRKVNLIKQAAICSGFITIAELIFGFFVNILFNVNVWDYSKVYGNFMGQICIPFSFVWFLISFPCLYFCRLLKKCLEE